MFHKRMGHIVTAILLLSLCAQPIMSHASELAPRVTAEAVPPTHVKTQTADGFSFETLRQNSKAKLSTTQHWVKDKTRQKNLESPIKTLERKIDRLQDRVKPAGWALKRSIKKHLPGKSLAQKGDRTFSVYGILLMMAFVTLFMGMSLSNPTSRLGGRH